MEDISLTCAKHILDALQGSPLSAGETCQRSRIGRRLGIGDKAALTAFLACDSKRTPFISQERAGAIAVGDSLGRAMRTSAVHSSHVQGLVDALELEDLLA